MSKHPENSTPQNSKPNSTSSAHPRVKYYFDEHVDKAIVKALRRKGIDVLRAEDIHSQGATDKDQLAYAYEQGRVLMTRDEDFLVLASEGQPHTGIVYVPQNRPFSAGKIIKLLELIWEVITPEAMRGHVEHGWDVEE